MPEARRPNQQRRWRLAAWVVMLASVAMVPPLVDARPVPAEPANSATMPMPGAVRYRTAAVDGVKVFYREAGDPAKPAILLLHGFSSSSHMFRDLLPLLAGHFHLIAPDYPGFGHSDAPPGSQFEPTFANLESFMAKFAGQTGMKNFILYMQDFGGPVGFRMATKHPEWVKGLIVQNANAYTEGLPAAIVAAMSAQTASTAPRQPTSARVVNAGFIKYLYTDGARDAAALNPDAWALDIAVLQNPEARRIQSALIDEYFNNIALYPQWQAYMRQRQPKTLVVWGRNDHGFSPQGAEAFRRDLRDLELRYYETGHFALEEDAGPIARAIIARFASRR
jgi:pimeloyl-ACP methyl ester carboxylesterase